MPAYVTGPQAAAASEARADEGHRFQPLARGLLGLVLVLLGLFTLHDFLISLAWAAVFAIATWPLFRRAKHRLPEDRHNLLLPLAFTSAIALIFIVPLVLIGVEAGREAQGVLTWMEHARHAGVPVPSWPAGCRSDSPSSAGGSRTWPAPTTPTRCSRTCARAAASR